MNKMKINYPFKKYDWVDCSDRTKEEIQAMLERMWELGAVKCDDIDSFYRADEDSLSWNGDTETYFLPREVYTEKEEYNEVLWEEILPTISTEGLEEISKIDQEMGLYEEPTKEECYDGGEVDVGCSHDNCTGPVVKSIPPVTEWKCFEQVAKVLGEEDAEYELNLVRLKALDGHSFNTYTERSLNTSFDWWSAPQESLFWEKVNNGDLPESYIKQKESTKDSSQTLGELVELLQVGLTPTPLSISVSADGVFLHGEGFPTVDVTKLDSAVVDKLIEVFTEVEGCFVAFNEEGE